MTNKPMLSVEREHRLKIHRKPFLDLESGAKTCEIRDCSDRDFQVGDSVLLRLVDETGNPTPNELRRKITHIQTGYGLPDDLCVLSYEPAAKHQGEPVAIPRISGIGRDADHPKALVLYLAKVPDDNDIRAIQNALRQPDAQTAHVAVQISWSDVEPWYLANEQRLSDIRKFEGPKGFALEVWRGARLNGVVADGKARDV